MPGSELSRFVLIDTLEHERMDGFVALHARQEVVVRAQTHHDRLMSCVRDVTQPNNAALHPVYTPHLDRAECVGWMSREDAEYGRPTPGSLEASEEASSVLDGGESDGIGSGRVRRNHIFVLVDVELNAPLQ